MRKITNVRDLLDPYKNANREYRELKRLLSIRQRLLFLKYLFTLKKYNKLKSSLNLKQLADMVIDDSLIFSKEYIVVDRILKCYDEEYILDLDAEKYLKAKETVSLEIARINAFMDAFYSQGGEYRSNYSEQDIRDIPSDLDESTIEHVIQMNNEYEYIKNNPEKKVISLEDYRKKRAGY